MARCEAARGRVLKLSTERPHCTPLPQSPSGCRVTVQSRPAAAERTGLSCCSVDPFDDPEVECPVAKGIVADHLRNRGSDQIAHSGEASSLSFRQPVFESGGLDRIPSRLREEE